MHVCHTFTPQIKGNDRGILIASYITYSPLHASGQHLILLR